MSSNIGSSRISHFLTIGIYTQNRLRNRNTQVNTRRNMYGVLEIRRLYPLTYEYVAPLPDAAPLMLYCSASIRELRFHHCLEGELGSLLVDLDSKFSGGSNHHGVRCLGLTEL